MGDRGLSDDPGNRAQICAGGGSERRVRGFGLSAVENLTRSCSERAKRRLGHIEKSRVLGDDFDGRNSDVTVCNRFTGLAGRMGRRRIVFPGFLFVPFIAENCRRRFRDFERVRILTGS